MTLTETATFTKRFLRVALVFGGAFLILWIVFLVVYNNIYVPYQRSQVQAEKKFGALPRPQFPPSLVSSASLTYTIDTPSGFLPADFPKLLNVYFIPPSEVGLLSPDRARRTAVSLGFINGPDILSASQYRFADKTGGTMTIGLTTGNFSTKRGNPTPETIQADVLPGLPEIVGEFKSYIGLKGLMKPGLETGQAQAFLDPTGQTAIVSLWPGEIEAGMPIVTLSPSQSLVRATVTKYQDEAFKYSSLNYTYWTISNETFSSYFTKPVTQAFEELKQGAGVVVKNQTSGSKASISKVYLAYYLPEEYNSFLEPVFVFESGEFTAYVPALMNDSYAQ